MDKQRLPALRPRRGQPSVLCAAVSVSLLLYAAAATRAADTSYKIQRIFQMGDRVADVNTRPTNNGISLEGLNDRGQLLFETYTVENPNGAALLRYAEGQFTVIQAPDRSGPLGIWPKDLNDHAPSSMNQAGNAVFAAIRWNNGDNIDLGLLLWDAQTGKATPLVVPGEPTADNLTFEGLDWEPVLNNRGEIAFPGWGSSFAGLFLRSPEGKLQPVTRAGDAMPDGRIFDRVWRPSLNDAGVITFRGRAADDPADSAFRWEKGVITPVAVLGMEAPQGGKIRAVWGALVNNQNSSVLVLAAQRVDGPIGLYRFADGKLATVAVPGQTMPDGGLLSDIPLGYYGVGRANERGQHAFLARLQDGSTAAYLLDPDGKLTLIQKSGATTEVGQITLVGSATRLVPGLFRVGAGIGLNSQGQVAFNVRIDGGPTTLVLLTPGALAPGG